MNFFPLIKLAYAVDDISAEQLLNRVTTYIIWPIVSLIFSVALLIFLWGVVEFIQGAANPDAREKGKSHMIYGLLGLVVMFGVYGIMRIIANFWN